MGHKHEASEAEAAVAEKLPKYSKQKREFKKAFNSKQKLTRSH